MSISKKTLLLNNSFEVIGFIPDKRAFKLLYKNKAEVISNWDEMINWIDESKINHPSILKLNEQIKRSYVGSIFSRKAVYRRDKYTCSYCGKLLNKYNISIDHIIPVSQGGKTTYQNCVVACKTCNNFKDNRTPEEANMILLIQPKTPSLFDYYAIDKPVDQWHIDWDSYL